MSDPDNNNIDHDEEEIDRITNDFHDHPGDHLTEPDPEVEWRKRREREWNEGGWDDEGDSSLYDECLAEQKIERRMAEFRVQAQASLGQGVVEVEPRTGLQGTVIDFSIARGLLREVRRVAYARSNKRGHKNTTAPEGDAGAFVANCGEFSLRYLRFLLKSYGRTITLGDVISKELARLEAK